MSDWKNKVLLKDGETLVLTGRSSKGFMAETDVETYDVVDADGQKVGSVTMEDHTAVKGLRRTISVVQVDLAGEVLVREAWRD